MHEKICVQDTSMWSVFMPERMKLSWPYLWTVSSLYTSLTFLYTSLTFLLCNVMVLTIPHPFVPAVFKHRVWRGRNNHSRTHNAENCLCASTASWRGSCWQPLLHHSKTDSKPYIFFALRLCFLADRRGKGEGGCFALLDKQLQHTIHQK